MAYVAGDQISTQEYNGFLNNTTTTGTPPVLGINHIMGTGSLFYGLGQTALFTVNAQEKITGTQWNSLFTAMDNLANHANINLTSTSQRTAGDKIEIKSALGTDITSIAAEVAGGCGSATAVTTSVAQQTTAASGRWNGSHIVEQSTTFTNANEMRWFFNQGGKIQINVTRTGNGGSAATQKDQAMDDLIDSLGNFRIKSQASDYSEDGSTNVNTLTTNALTIGFYDLTTSYQTILELTQDWATYNTMYVRFEAKLDASPGTSTVLTVKTSLVDPDAGDGQFTAGNTASIDQYANFIGVTNMVLKYVKATTGEGLTTIYEPFTTAVVSNNIT